MRKLAMIAVLALLAAACGDSGETTTTTTSPPVGPGTTAAVTTTTTIPVTTTTTVPPETTTTAAPTTTTVPATTTTASTLPLDATDVALAKVEPILDLLPEGWTGSLDTGPQGENANDIVFTPCLDEDDFDLDQLDAVSAGIAEVDVQGLPGTFGAPEANIEARVFQSQDLAEAAFGVLEKILGTDEGRQCLADTVSAGILSDLPDDADASLEVEAFSTTGADVGTRVAMSVTAGGLTVDFFIDLLATRIGDCTVFASFISATEPFPEAEQQLFFSAAVGG